MTITLEEMKNYLRVDFEDDDRLIEGLIRSGQKMCMDILRTDDPAVLENPDARAAVLYAAAYQYEHREDDDNHALMISLPPIDITHPSYPCYASVSAEAGKEMTQAGMVVDDSSVDFTIRYCEKAKDINTTKYRVEFNSELYDIEGIDHMNYKKKSIKLKCRKVRR